MTGHNNSISSLTADHVFASYGLIALFDLGSRFNQYKIGSRLLDLAEADSERNDDRSNAILYFNKNLLANISRNEAIIWSVFAPGTFKLTVTLTNAPPQLTDGEETLDLLGFRNVRPQLHLPTGRIGVGDVFDVGDAELKAVLELPAGRYDVFPVVDRDEESRCLGSTQGDNPLDSPTNARSAWKIYLVRNKGQPFRHLVKKFFFGLTKTDLFRNTHEPLAKD